MRKKYFLSVAVMLALGYSATQAETLFVKPDATGDGTSWDNAASLEDALSWAYDGDEILVAKGTYTGSFKARAGFTVYGECNGNETTPPKIVSAEGLSTFLKGAGDGKRVLYIDQGPATFIGFDISNGDASNELVDMGRGGGVYINGGGGTLRYCNIHDNVGVDGSGQTMSATGVPTKGIGGGACVLQGNLEFCIIENNHAVTNPFENPDRPGVWNMGIGGGVALIATGKGATADDAIMASCIVRNNATTPADDADSYESQGGGIAVESGTVVNCLIYGNAVNGSNNNGNIGGGLACVGNIGPGGDMQTKIINCTVVDNSVKGLGGGISFQSKNATIKNTSVANCIVWNNTNRDDSYGEGYNNIRFSTTADNNGVSSGHSITVSTVIVPEATASETAITDDPKFTDADNNDFTLQEGSPAIDTGDDPAIEGFDTDLLGNNRIAGDAVDIGCYEFGSTGAPEPEPGNGIDVITEADGEIINTTYYTLQGAEVAYPTTSGIYIMKNTYESLKTQTQKVFVPIK